MPANLANVFMPLQQSSLDTDLQTNLISPNEINYSEGNSDEEDPDNQKSPDLKKRIVVVKTTGGGGDEDDEEETPQSYVRNFGKQQQQQSSSSQPNSILKTSRYFNYRSSLTNSVRGSLLEYTVPEDGLVPNDTYDMNNLDSASINFKGRRAHGHRSGRLGRAGYATNGNYGPNGRSRKDTGNGASDELFSLTFNPALMNTRRFVSTIDANGLLNVPVNLEAVEHNLRNSLIKKNSEHYRRSSRKSPAGNAEPASSALFPAYVSHVLGLNLFFNPLLVLLNVSFFFNIIGKPFHTNTNTSTNTDT